MKTRLLSFLFFLFLTSKLTWAQPAPAGSGYGYGATVVTHFSGLSGGGSATTPGTPATGSVFTVFNTTNTHAATGWNYGANWSLPFTNTNRYHIHDANSVDLWESDSLGQVFGTAIDETGNIYLAATFAYGSHTYPNGRFPNRTKGSGSIYKISPSGAVNTSFVLTKQTSSPGTVGQNWLPNATFGFNAGALVYTYNQGPGLGDLTYSRIFKELYVSNMEDGSIYGIDPNSGNVKFRFDPTFNVSGAAGLDNGLAGPPPLKQRVWGLGTYGSNKTNTKLYYARWSLDGGHGSATDHNEIWSVKLDPLTGAAVASSEVLEVKLPYLYSYNSAGNTPFLTPTGNETYSMPVSDMTFDVSGNMYVAERGIETDFGYPHHGIYYKAGTISGSGVSDYVVLTNNIAHRDRVIKYTPSGTSWSQGPVLGTSSNINQFEIGCPGGGMNSSGGIDIGFNKKEAKRGNCDSMVWVSGDFYYLNCPANTGQKIYGMQGLSSNGGTIAQSYFIDYDNNTTDNTKLEQGDVEVYRDSTSCPINPYHTDSISCPRVSFKNDSHCCVLNASITNMPTTAPLTNIFYTVTGGVAQSISTSGCYPSSTTTIPNSTTGSLTFTGCTGLTGITGDFQSTTLSGLVTVSLTLVFQGSKTSITCRYTTNIYCKPAPQTKCDSISISSGLDNNASTGGHLNYLDYQIFNQKIPYAPIAYVTIELRNSFSTPSYPFTGDVGSRLSVNYNTTYDPWQYSTASSPAMYNRIPRPTATPYIPDPAFNCNPAVDHLSFRLALDENDPWTGNVNITIVHCDSGRCSNTYSWNPSVASGGIWKQIDQVGIHDSLFAATFAVSPDKTGRQYAENQKIKWVQVSIVDNTAEIYAVSGGKDEYKGMEKDSGLDIRNVIHSNKSATFELKNPVHPDSIKADNHFNMVFKNGRPTLKFYFINSGGRILSKDSVTVKSARTTAVNLEPYRSPQSNLILSVSPNPAKDMVNMKYSITEATNVSILITDMNGKEISEVLNTYNQPGIQSVNFSVSVLAAGVYNLELKTKAGIQTVRLIVTK
jgi:hypothetical protein